MTHAPVPARDDHVDAGAHDQVGDEVDLVLAAWRRERPDLDTSPMQVWSRITRLGLHLDAARRRVFADHGLEPWEFDVLAALRRAGVPYRLTPGQLVRQTHVTSGTMTNRVDRLAVRGFVTRASDPADGRGVLVELLEPGLVCVDGALGDLLVAERALLAGLDAGDGRALERLLRALLTRVGAPAAQLSGVGPGDATVGPGRRG